MNTTQDSDDKAAAVGSVARLVRCSSFVDLLPVFAGWVILLVTLALMLAGVGQFFGWWDIDMRRQTAQDEVADFAEASDPGCDY